MAMLLDYSFAELFRVSVIDQKRSKEIEMGPIHFFLGRMTTVNKVVDSGIITTSLLLTNPRIFEELTFLSILTVRTIQWTKTTPPHLELYALLFTAYTFLWYHSQVLNPI